MTGQGNRLLNYWKLIQLFLSLFVVLLDGIGMFDDLRMKIGNVYTELIQEIICRIDYVHTIGGIRKDIDSEATVIQFLYTLEDLTLLMDGYNKMKQVE